MLDPSPVKLLLVFVVAVILLGPDKLPQVARQLGAGWRKLRDFHEQVDREIRENIPDLPSSQEIARLARSPVALLNQLAEMPSRDELVEDPGAAPAVAEDVWRADPGAVEPGWTAPVEPPGTTGDRATSARPPVPEDPSMN